MSIAATAQAISPQAVRLPDRRRHRRIECQLGGRFMGEGRSEAQCTVTNVSVGGAAFLSGQPVKPGERVVAYIDELGRLEGTVFRKLDDGFVVSLEGTARWREKLAAQLMWLVNRDQLQGLERRRAGHERIALGTTPSVITGDDGSAFECRILDISISGAAVACPQRPAVGSAIWLADIPATVVRHHESGVAVQFDAEQTVDDLKSRFGV